VCGSLPPAGAGRRLELADIFRAHGAAYRKTRMLCGQQDRVLRAIAACRTAAMGGHATRCDACGAIDVRYHSCRNRHCPKCQTLAKEHWLTARCAELLPVAYFHVVFTLPHQLNALAQGNPRVIYDLLFRSAAETLQGFGRDPKWLGGELGITGVLHTWGQNLTQHLHLHCVVTGGALSADGQRWIRARRGFLFPVRALSRMFRGKYLDYLRAAYASGELHFAGHQAALGEPAAFARFVADARRHDWVVYAKRPFAGPAQVLNYLGRYTHRVAIGNHRLVSLEDGAVRFRFKDYARGNKVKVMSLAAEEFIRRFLLHVLPCGFMRIRHYGVLANRHRAEKLAQCRNRLDQPEPLSAEPETVADFFQRVAGIDIHRCPHCRIGYLHTFLTLQPAGAQRLAPPATGPPGSACWACC
jgi:hypothetical protein